MSHIEVGLVEVGSLKDAVGEVRTGEVAVAKVGTLEVDVTQVKVRQVQSLKIQALNTTSMHACMCICQVTINNSPLHPLTPSPDSEVNLQRKCWPESGETRFSKNAHWQTALCPTHTKTHTHTHDQISSSSSSSSSSHDSPAPVTPEAQEPWKFQRTLPPPEHLRQYTVIYLPSQNTTR